MTSFRNDPLDSVEGKTTDNCFTPQVFFGANSNPDPFEQTFGKLVQYRLRYETTESEI